MNVHVAAAGRERVDGVVIEYDEFPFFVGETALPSHALTDFADVVLKGLVVVDPVGFEDLLVCLARTRALLRFTFDLFACRRLGIEMQGR